MSKKSTVFGLDFSCVVFFVFFFCFFFLENHLCYSEYKKLYILLDFSGGIVDKNLSANAGDPSLIPGPGRFYMLWNS